jgi:Protein of unknown function (DUF2971).
MLYHYTTLETLHAILQNYKDKDDSPNVIFLVLRATHAYFLNDSKEAQLLVEALIKIDIPENVIKTCDLLNGYPFVFSLNDEYSFVKCEYVTTEDIASKLESEPSIKEWKKSNCDNNGHYEANTISRILLDTVKYKHKAFEEEKEHRVVILSAFDEKFRATSEKIVPYKEFLIPISAIKSVTLGPKAEVEKNSFSIKRMLKQLGVYNIDVKHSHIPYQ